MASTMRSAIGVGKQANSSPCWCVVSLLRNQTPCGLMSYVHSTGNAFRSYHLDSAPAVRTLGRTCLMILYVKSGRLHAQLIPQFTAGENKLCPRLEKKEEEKQKRHYDNILRLRWNRAVRTQQLAWPSDTPDYPRSRRPTLKSAKQSHIDEIKWYMI